MKNEIEKMARCFFFQLFRQIIQPEIFLIRLKVHLQHSGLHLIYEQY